MTSKKGDKGTTSGNLPALKIGSRVRCTDDGVEGRITWANGTSVKIQWDDGEQVTWRRDSLADRPIAILDPAGEVGHDAIGIHADGEPSVSTESPREEPSPTPPAPQETTTEPTQPATTMAFPVTEPCTAELASPVPNSAEGKPSPALTDTTVETTVQSKRRRKAPAAPKAKKRSALDAAAQVLAEAGQPRNCQELIAVMAQKGYWTSPKRQE